MAVAASLQGTAVDTLDPEAARIRAFQEMVRQLGTISAEAAANASSMRGEADQARQQFMNAAQAPIEGLAPPPQAAIASILGGFGRALSPAAQRTPDIGELLSEHRKLVLERRAEVLQTLQDQYVRAAREAEQAGDTATSIKFNEKAKTTMEGYQLIADQLGAKERRQENRDTQARQMRFEEWQTRFVQGEITRRAKEENSGAGAGGKGQVDILKKGFEERMKPLAEQHAMLLGMSGKDAAARAEALETKILALQSEYLGELDKLAKQPSPPPPGTTAATPPAAAPDPVGQVVAALRARGIATREAAMRLLRQPDPSGGNVGQALVRRGIDLRELLDRIAAAPAQRLGAGFQAAPAGR